ncbi:MAG: 30S ribosomal protein S2, partial [Bacteroidales bacterium]|nr:30S ribosomal protein S2 [Bacteroidales bacterium]
LNIPTFAIVDTNSNPNLIDFPIPANDDASKSIELIISKMVEAIEEGLAERKNSRDKEDIVEEEMMDDENVMENKGEDEEKEERRPRRPRKAVNKK